MPLLFNPVCLNEEHINLIFLINIIEVCVVEKTCWLRRGERNVLFAAIYLYLRLNGQGRLAHVKNSSVSNDIISLILDFDL